MKILKISFACVLFLAAALFSSCNKEADMYAGLDDISNAAFLKVYNAAINTSRNHVFIDNSKITGTALASGGVFPLTGFYSALGSGTRTLVMRDTLATTTQNVISLYRDWEKGKRYTFFLYDSTNAVKHKIVEDNLQVPTDGTVRIRFANFIYSSSAIPNVDLYSFKKGTNIFTNISPTSVTEFETHNAGADSLFVRATGTTTNLAKIATTPVANRMYTYVFRGQYQATTGTLARTLSSFASY
jgi:hypothetical protein